LNKKNDLHSKIQLSKSVSFDLIDELIQFEGQIAILGELTRHSLLESKRFNYSRYNVELHSLLETHEKNLQQLKTINPADFSI
jgi:hypothetical protein